MRDVQRKVRRVVVAHRGRLFVVAASSLSVVALSRLASGVSVPVSLAASSLIVATFLVAVSLPRRLARRAGLLAAWSFSMLVLAAIGLTIGAFDESCRAWSGVCARTLAGWMSAWMLLVPVAQAALVLLALTRRIAAAPWRFLARRLADWRRRSR